MADCNEILLIKCGELALKGLNRGTFEAVLMKNLRRRLTPLGHFHLRKAQSTIYIEPQDDAADLDRPAIGYPGCSVFPLFPAPAWCPRRWRPSARRRRLI